MYLIIYFGSVMACSMVPRLGNYSVILTNWIVENNNTQSDALFCKWPPYNMVTSDHLRTAINPSQS